MGFVTNIKGPAGQPGSGTRTVVANDVVSASTGFADVTGLTFAVEASKIISFHAYLLRSSSGTGEGANFAINGPAGAAVRVWRVVFTSATAQISEAQSAYDTGTLLTTGPGAAMWPVEIFGMVATGGTSGTLAIRFRTETGGANSTTVRRGSFAIWYTN